MSITFDLKKQETPSWNFAVVVSKWVDHKQIAICASDSAAAVNPALRSDKSWICTYLVISWFRHRHGDKSRNYKQYLNSMLFTYGWTQCKGQNQRPSSLNSYRFKTMMKDNGDVLIEIWSECKLLIETATWTSLGLLLSSKCLSCSARIDC